MHYHIMNYSVDKIYNVESHYSGEEEEEEDVKKSHAHTSDKISSSMQYTQWQEKSKCAPDLNVNASHML